MPIFWLPEKQIAFPPIGLALDDGLLAVGGDLSPVRLLAAYREGIFPWYNTPPILWWSPDPRFVLFPYNLKVSKSMRPYFNQKKFQVTFDQDFRGVISACRNQYRPGQEGTWIDDDMIDAYTLLHMLGYAHSVEVYQDGNLVGGLYGLLLGRIFFGESMFSRISNAGKFGFITLVWRLRAAGCTLIDCQTPTRYLASLGAEGIPRDDFAELLSDCNVQIGLEGSKWREGLPLAPEEK